MLSDSLPGARMLNFFLAGFHYLIRDTQKSLEWILKFCIYGVLFQYLTAIFSKNLFEVIKF